MNQNKLIIYNQENIDNLRETNSKIIKYKDKLFKIITKLGRGSFGIVYKVKDLNNNKIVVLKNININNLKLKYRESVLNEAKFLKNFDHKNIIKYITSFKENYNLYIIMEYANGGDLYNYIKKLKQNNRYFKEKKIWKIINELSSALLYLHKKNVIHRDVKTLNIFLDKEGNVKLGDFGVSKIIKKELLAKETRVGTPLYLAPELIKTKSYDYKIDIWAWGCVIYQLCTLQYPFNGENLIKLGYNIINKHPKWFNYNNYSNELKNFCYKCLDKNALNRPNSQKCYDYSSTFLKNKESIKNIDSNNILPKSNIKINKKFLEKEREIVNNKNKMIINEKNNFIKISELNNEKEENQFNKNNFTKLNEINKPEIKKIESNPKEIIIGKKIENIGNLIKKHKIENNNKYFDKKLNENKNLNNNLKNKPPNNNIFKKNQRPVSTYQKMRNINELYLNNNEMYKIFNNNFKNKLVINKGVTQNIYKKKYILKEKINNEFIINNNNNNLIKKNFENINNDKLNSFETNIELNTNESNKFCLHFGDYLKIKKKINFNKNRPQTALIDNIKKDSCNFVNNDTEKNLNKNSNKKSNRPQTAFTPFNYKNNIKLENHDLFKFKLKGKIQTQIIRKNTIKDL